ncbi:MAG: hypothetical protein J6M60_02875 [Clostridia bacterium]|nr:hypothetical protein [Clostridia bacterium]
MEVNENNIVKLCSFYVSDWHLVTMLLPYINQKINEEVEIATILEKDLNGNITKLVERLNLNNREKILKLNWNKFKERGKIIYNKDNKEKVLIINGEKEFVENINKRIEKYFKTHKVNGIIKIVNCFEITGLDGNISDILDEHDKVLNTSGERAIEEVFTDYVKNEKIKKAI